MDKNQQKSTLSARQERAIAAVMESTSIAAAMKKARINRATFYLWLRDDPLFASALKQRQTALYESAAADLKSMLTRAVRELGDLLKSRDERTRLSAVKEVLDRTSAAFEQQSLITRIEQLEQQIEKMETR